MAVEAPHAVTATAAAAAQACNVVWSPQAGPQTSLITCPCSDILYGGARGGGKTDGSIGDWISHAMTYGAKARGIWFRRTLEELADVKERMRALFLLVGARFKTQDNAWVFPNGAKLLLRYLETDADADKYLGHQYTWMCVEELGNFKSPIPIDKVKGTLRSAGGVKVRFIATANPGGKGHKWIKERYVDPAPPNTPFQDPVTGVWRVYIPSKLSDNRLLVESDPDYGNRLKGTGPSWLVKAWLDGDWNIAMDGKIFLREWWDKRRYTAPPDEIAKRCYQTVQSWDMAAREGEQNDRSVCITAGLTSKGWYILDVWAGRLTFPDLKRKVGELAAKWNCFEILIEDKSSGQGVLDELKRDTTFALKGINPVGSKFERALSVSSLIEEGCVWLPEMATWLSDFMDELAGFPGGAHDDIVDALSQLLRYLAARYTLGDALAPAFTEEPKAPAHKNTFSSPASNHAADFYGSHAGAGDDFNHSRRGLF